MASVSPPGARGASPRGERLQFDVLELTQSIASSPSRFERDVTPPTEAAYLESEGELWRLFLGQLGRSGVRYGDVKGWDEPERERLVEEHFPGDVLAQEVVLRKWRRLEHTTARYPTLPRRGHAIDAAKESRVRSCSSGLQVTAAGESNVLERGVAAGGGHLRSTSPRRHGLVTPSHQMLRTVRGAGVVSRRGAMYQTRPESTEEIAPPKAAEQAPPYMCPSVARAKAAMRVRQQKQKQAAPKGASKQVFRVKEVSHVSPIRNRVEAVAVRSQKKKSSRRAVSEGPAAAPSSLADLSKGYREAAGSNAAGEAAPAPVYFTRGRGWVPKDGRAQPRAGSAKKPSGPRHRSASPYSYRPSRTGSTGTRHLPRAPADDAPLFPAGAVVTAVGLGRLYPSLEQQLGKVLGPAEGQYVPVAFPEPFGDMMVPVRNLEAHPYLRDIPVAGNPSRSDAAAPAAHADPYDPAIPVALLPR